MAFLFVSKKEQDGRDENPRPSTWVRNRPKGDSRGAVRHAKSVRVIPSSLLKANFKIELPFLFVSKKEQDGRDENPRPSTWVRNRPKGDSRGAVRHAKSVRVIPSSYEMSLLLV